MTGYWTWLYNSIMNVTHDTQLIKAIKQALCLFLMLASASGMIMGFVGMLIDIFFGFCLMFISFLTLTWGFYIAKDL